MRNKILIVDDTKSWQLFHLKLIKDLYGNLFELTVASSAREALNIAINNKSEPFMLIITDLQMEMSYEPLLAGEWLIENVKLVKEYFAVKMVIISSMHNIEYIAKKYNVDCISKSMLVSNKLLMKYMFEKLMPFLTQIDSIHKK